MANIELTAEQEKVANSRANTLVVNAFAGTGKTSVLVEYARRRPEKRMIYLAFNRAIKEEAASRFPSNVRAVTTHGLAFPKFGTLLSKKLGNPKASHVAKLLSCDMLTAGYALAVVNNFMASPDPAISEVHAIPVILGAEPAALGRLVDLAHKIWLAMIDPGVADFPAAHDAYLKQYQISSPLIRTDTLLFDEAQDANPTTLDFVLRQSCSKVIVGDRYQSIYQFRGAVDALSLVKGDERLLISESFRFGDGIADIASGLLRDWRGEPNPIIGMGAHQTVFAVDPNGPHTIIARSNGQIFAEAVALVFAKRPFAFVGGVEGYRFDQILDTYQLFARQKGSVRDPFIASFEDFTLMRQYGDELDDREVKGLVNVVNEYQHQIPTLIEQIRKLAIPNPSGQEVMLSTAHKSKGLQWMDVVLANDFAELKVKTSHKSGEMLSPPPEEINVLYVAATRAQRGIQLPMMVRDWLAESGRSALLRRVANDKPVCSAPLIVVTDPKQKSLLDQFVAIEGQITALKSALGSNTEAAAVAAQFLRDQADYLEGIGRA